jgi:hypothetical protein
MNIANALPFSLVPFPFLPFFSMSFKAATKMQSGMYIKNHFLVYFSGSIPPSFWLYFFFPLILARVFELSQS